MSINFPTSIDSFVNPASGDTQAAVPHATQHANANDAITALETKVGVNNSAVTTTHDYKLSGVTGSDKAVSKTGTETLTNKTLTSPKINVTSDATGDIYYRNSGGIFTRLPIGTTGQILDVSSGGIPEWVANPSAKTFSMQIQKYTASGTWTKQTGLQYVIVEVQAGGAGGNGSGNGGGGGGYSRKLIPVASLGATETVTVGSGGASTVDGGSSSFGSHVSATGGVSSTGVGGIGSNGDINIQGSDGGSFDSFATSTGGSGGAGGDGGSSHLGGGGAGTTTNAGNGNNGRVYGGGGGGGEGGGAGGTGADGIVIVTEFYYA